MRYLTYNEWQDEGFQVLKGERSHKRNDLGEAVFSEDQVADMSEDYDYDELWFNDPEMGDR